MYQIVYRRCGAAESEVERLTEAYVDGRLLEDRDRLLAQLGQTEAALASARADLCEERRLHGLTQQASAQMAVDLCVEINAQKARGDDAERLREALREISDCTGPDWASYRSRVHRIVRGALAARSDPA